MNTPYEQLVDVNNIASFNSKEDIAAIIACGKNERMTPASQDQNRTLLLAIDVQNDFMEEIGSLPVSGSKGDVARLTQWIYQNTQKLSQIICSVDCHSITQIFNSAWWKDSQDNEPQPFTIITHDDIVNGKWQVTNGEIERTLAYLKNLEATSRKQLCIWPYHCLEGSTGAQLESEFTKMVYFHSAARNSTPQIIRKGKNPYTEMYGIIKAEYDPTAYINQSVLDAVKESDAIFIAGEASSHCVLASVSQIVEHFSANREITSRITVLEDCMSPIAGFEESTQRAFYELKDKYGIQIRKSVDVVLY